MHFQFLYFTDVFVVFLKPAAVMSFVGLAALVHYNDERRAVLKGFHLCSLLFKLGYHD